MAPTMTRLSATAPAALQVHARELAAAFMIRLVESEQLKPEEALALPHIRVALVAPVIDETTYAVALHELGHLAAPLGDVRGEVVAKPANLRRLEEAAAWEWARHYALMWSPLMDQIARYGEASYADEPATAEPPAPVASTRSINWNDWK